MQSTTSKVPEDEMKDVVNKLVKHYNIDKLKDLTRVNLQSKGLRSCSALTAFRDRAPYLHPDNE